MNIYDGPSEINGKPILGILIVSSNNAKTGDMSQLHILPKRVDPLTASKTGYDEAVCGKCPLRHSTGGACYVNVGQGPAIVYKAWKRGKYLINTLLKREASFKRKRIRLGAYGDPAALPLDVVKKLVSMFDGHTGYTHQWRTCDQGFSDLLMASVENEADYYEAKAKGWRTYRVVKDYSEMTPNERACPSGPKGVQCADCVACHGKGNRADIAIQIHGTWKKRIKWEPEVAPVG